MRQQRNHIDLPILIAVLILIVIGLGVVYSASSTWAWEKYGESDKLLESHAVKVLIGFLTILIFMHIDYRLYKKITKPALLACVLGLVITLSFGGELKGAVRSLTVGGFSIQPSEFARYALLFHLALLLSQKKEGVRDFKTGFIPLMIWVGLITLLVLLQPNFSNGAMIVAVSILLLFVGGVRLSHLGLTMAALIPPLALYLFSASYRIDRIKSFIGGTGSVNYQLATGNSCVR
jgi:cell division protein FtsW